MKIKSIISIGLIVSVAFSTGQATNYYMVQVDPGPQRGKSLIQEYNLDVVNERQGGFIQIIADEDKLNDLRQDNIQFKIIKELSTEFVPDYPSYSDVVASLEIYNAFYPDITEIYEIGESQRHRIPIYAIKVSDNADTRENEPVVWIDGVHHAREPMGMMSCMDLLDTLVVNYGNDSLITSIVDGLDIWIIPILNVDGYIYFIDLTDENPWWRKNQRDNNENGSFDYSYDGVDLNRNYDLDFYESNAGSSEPSSWVYRGSSPFSEREVLAKRNHVNFLRPLSGITYHSYGEVIFYSSGANGHSIPETGIIDDFAFQVASRIPRINNVNSYTYAPDWYWAPMSYYWMFQALGTWEMLVETGTEFVPSYPIAKQVAHDNVSGAMYLLQRSLEGPGIQGNVTSSHDGNPIRAIVKIVEYWDSDLAPRRTEQSFGRFNRFTDPGTYTIEFSADNYASDTLYNVVVDSGWTDASIQLTPLSLALVDDVIPTQFLLYQNYPNPFNPVTKLQYDLPQKANVNIIIYDTRGREVRTMVNQNQEAGSKSVVWNATDDLGQPVSAGVYLYRIQAGDFVQTRKMVLLK